MERLKELITQLKEQFDRKAEPSQMLETAKLLEAELQLLASQPPPAKVIPTKITVMMPSASKIHAGQPATQQAPAPEPRREQPSERREPSPERREPAPEARREPAPERHELTPEYREPSPERREQPSERHEQPSERREPVAERKEPVQEPRKEPVTQRNGTPLNGTAIPAAPAPTVTQTQPETPVEIVIMEKPAERGQWPFDPLAEKPTDRFTLSQRAREVNDVIGSGTSSLNDKLKSEVADLKSALNDTPVRDLKKAIGVNDRYVFINQLFRGDEVMYERSLKTINGFRILPEAEYWMERELKVKLGWDENREATRHFYQLVKRRFS
jgi:hypothetical protein